MNEIISFRDFLIEKKRFNPISKDIQTRLQSWIENNVMMGFEVECYAPNDVYDVESGLDYSQIIRDFEREGLDISNLKAVRDSSLKTDPNAGVEFISIKPMPYKEGFEYYKSFIEGIKAIGFWVDETCGMHVSVSVKGLESLDEVNWLKVLILSGSDYVQESFKRMNRPHLNSLYGSLKYLSNVDYFSSIKPLSNFSPEKFKKLEDSVSRYLSREKYVNLKLGDFYEMNGRLEYRVPGGKDTLNYEKVKMAVDRLLVSIYHGWADPKSYQREYYTKLTKILSKVLGVNQEHTGIDRMEYIKLYAESKGNAEVSGKFINSTFYLDRKAYDNSPNLILSYDKLKKADDQLNDMLLDAKSDPGNFDEYQYKTLETQVNNSKAILYKVLISSLTQFERLIRFSPSVNRSKFLIDHIPIVLAQLDPELVKIIDLLRDYMPEFDDRIASQLLRIMTLNHSRYPKLFDRFDFQDEYNRIKLYKYLKDYIVPNIDRAATMTSYSKYSG